MEENYVTVILCIGDLSCKLPAVGTVLSPPASGNVEHMTQKCMRQRIIELVNRITSYLNMKQITVNQLFRIANYHQYCFKCLRLPDEFDSPAERTYR